MPQWAAVTKGAISLLMLPCIHAQISQHSIDTIISVHSFFGDVVHLDNSVAVSDEKTSADVVPGNGGNLVVFGGLDLLGFSLGLNLLELVVSVSNSGGIFRFEVPDFPSEFGSDGNPMASRVESQAGDGGFHVMSGVRFFNIAEVENSNFKIFSTSDDEVSSRRNSDGIDVGIMSSEAVLNVESLVVPDFKVSVPSD